MLNVVQKRQSFEEILSVLMGFGYERCCILSDNPIFLGVKEYPVNCVVCKKDIMKNGYNSLAEFLINLQVTGIVLVDKQLDCSEAWIQRLIETGHKVQVFELMNGGRKVSR